MEKSWILALDTATNHLGVALWDAQTGRSFVFCENVFRKQAALLHPTVDDLLKQAGIKMKDIGAIAVTKGPGSYTGIRVSMAAAQGYQLVLGMPIITLSTLEVIAQSASTAGTFYVRGHSGKSYTQEFDEKGQAVSEAEFVEVDEGEVEYPAVDPLTLAQLGYERLQANSADVNNMQPFYVSGLNYKKTSEK